MINKFLYLLFLFCSLSLPFQASSEILECPSLLDALPYIDEQTYVFYEIDDVLVRGSTIVSQTSFFEALKGELLKKGETPKKICESLYPLWVNVQLLSKAQPYGSESFEFFDQLPTLSNHVFGLSHRGPKLAYFTIDQLRNYGLYYTPPEEYKFHYLSEDQRTIYFQGTLFVHPADSKAKSLVHFLDENEMHPEKIVCLDNKLIHLVELGNSCEERGIEFIGIYLRQNECPLSDRDMEIGKLQLEYVDKILPNHFAKYIVESSEE